MSFFKVKQQQMNEFAQISVTAGNYPYKEQMIGIVLELILLAKQSTHSDTFLYVVGAIIANVQLLHGRKVVILFVIL